jgi:hypothetical protein
MAGLPTRDYYARMHDYHYASERLSSHLKEAEAARHEHTRLYHSQMAEHYRKLMG